MPGSASKVTNSWIFGEVAASAPVAGAALAAKALLDGTPIKLIIAPNKIPAANPPAPVILVRSNIGSSPVPGLRSHVKHSYHCQAQGPRHCEKGRSIAGSARLLTTGPAGPTLCAAARPRLEAVLQTIGRVRGSERLRRQPTARKRKAQRSRLRFSARKGRSWRR